MKFLRFLFVTTLAVLSSCQLKTSRTASATLVQEAGEQRRTHEDFGTHLMISTQGPAASSAGLEIAGMGGNVIDVAAAITFAIAVERPQSTGLTGGGFMMLHLRKPAVTTAVDFREKAPERATENMFLDGQGNPTKKSQDGILAGAVPGLVAGILDVHQRYGKLTRQQVMAPAIQLAQNGFEVYPSLAEGIADRAELLRQSPDAMKIFFNAKGQPLKVGDKIVQADLAKTLSAISREGPRGFYSGWVAQAFVDEQVRRGGLITHKDLQTYNVIYRKPLVGKFRDYDIFTMPPPSSGGAHIIEILNILENIPLAKLGRLSPEAVHYTTSAMQLAYADRAAYMGDSDFVKVPLKAITSKAYAKEQLARIPADKALVSKDVSAGPAPKYEATDTTHFTVMDNQGNVVSSTQTINGLMGAGIVVKGTGMVLNNEMDDFAAKVGASNLFGAIGGKANAIQPKKRPLSSMTPTVVMKNGKPLVALGTPNGTRIITCVLQTLLNYLEYDLPLYESIAAVRYHHQWQPDELRVDTPFFDEELKEKLTLMGHNVHNDPYACRVQAVALEGGALHGASDPRGEGLSTGY